VAAGCAFPLAGCVLWWIHALLNDTGLEPDGRGADHLVDILGLAADAYTAGRYVGQSVTFVLGIFLATYGLRPLRTASVASLSYGLLLTALSVPVGATLLRYQGLRDLRLGQPQILAALGLNLAGYLVWALLGVAVGTAVRTAPAWVPWVVAPILYAGVDWLTFLAPSTWRLRYVLTPAGAVRTGTGLSTGQWDYAIGMEMSAINGVPYWWGGVALAGFALLALAATLVARRLVGRAAEVAVQTTGAVSAFGVALLVLTVVVCIPPALSVLATVVLDVL